MKISLFQRITSTFGIGRIRRANLYCVVHCRKGWLRHLSAISAHWILLGICIASPSVSQAAATALVWDNITSPQLVGQPIPVELRAVDSNNELATEVNGPADISLKQFEQGGFGTGAWWMPLHTYYEDARTQSIYLSSELGQAGTITGIALDVVTPPSIPLENFTIRMKHTTQDEYLGQYDWETSGWTIVYQATETISEAGWTQFNLAVPFAYNGTDNLMVDLSFNNSSYDVTGEVRYTDTGDPFRSVYNFSDSLHGDPLTWGGDNPYPYYDSKLPNMRFFFGGNAGISPSEVNLINGQWSGSLVIDGAGDKVRISAHHAGSGISGVSNAFAVHDVTAPALISLVPQTAQSVDVSFSEPMGTGVLNPANYTVSGPGAGTVSPHPDNISSIDTTTYRLHWTSGRMINGEDLTVTVDGVSDLAGNAIGPQNSSDGVAVPVGLSEFSLE